MKKYFAILAAVLLAIPLLSSTYAIEEKSNSVHMYIVAVSKVHGRLVGEYSVLNVTIVQSPAGGHVYVEGYPLHDLTFSGAAWLASKVACSLLGVNFYDYNYYFSIGSQTFLIEGPSAGAAMAIGVISAILGEKPREDVVITGMIMPGGLIGPVGGISEKIYGAEEAGAKVFIVPIGQLTPELKEKGLQLGIDVVGVLDIYQALPYFIGEKIPTPSISAPLSPLNGTYLRKSCLLSLEYLKGKLNFLEKMEIGNGTFSSHLRQWISEAKNDTKSAERYYSLGDYYTSLSKLFQANISIQAAYFLLSYLKAKDKPRYLGELFQNVSKNVTEALDLVRGWPSQLPAQKFMILAAAQERAIEAKYYLEKANNTLGAPSTVPNFIYDLAYANARAGTVKWWYHFPVLGKGREINVYGKVLSFLGESEALLTYAEKCGILNSTYPEIEEIQREISLGISEDMLPGVFSLSAELQGEVMGYFLEYYYMASQNSTLIEEILREIKREALYSIISLEENGTQAITPRAYYEFANYLYSLGGSFKIISGQIYWTAKEIASSLITHHPVKLEKVPEYQPVRLNTSNGISAEIFLIIGIVSGIVIGSLIFSKKGKGGKEEGGDIERREDWNIFYYFLHIIFKLEGKVPWRPLEMRKLVMTAVFLISLFAIATAMIGCVEKPTTPMMYTPKLTIYVQNGKLMVYVRASMGNFLLYKEIWVKINNRTVLNESDVPGAFFSQNISYGIVNLTVYVKYVEPNGHVHIYEKTYTLKITEKGIIVNKIFYGKEYTKFLPEVKTNAWKIRSSKKGYRDRLGNNHHNAHHFLDLNSHHSGPHPGRDLDVDHRVHLDILHGDFGRDLSRNVSLSHDLVSR